MSRILVVDNYDSFVFTIEGYLQQIGAETTVVRNDAVSAADAAGYDGVLVSPGPGTPEEAGVSIEMIRGLCADVLGRPGGGQYSLFANNSRWVSFSTVRCQTWRHQNVVLLGDAAHTAHFSIGSGTKLAM